MEEKKILVVDDEKRMADSLQELLSNYDYTVDAAYSGSEAIDKLKKEKYHVVITDIRMADMDGFDVMGYINDHTPATQIIVITAHASTESAIEALHFKAFDYITKPFDFDSLRSTVERAFVKIEADTLREEMISMITHDIKLPLTSIIGFSNLLYDHETGQMNPKAREYANSIYLNSQKLLSLLDNFLTSCNINSGRLTVSECGVNINFLLDDLLSIVELSIENRGIHLEKSLRENPPLVTGDENLLFRALGNVLNNAVKYTPDEGIIKVRTGVASAAESPLHAQSLKIVVINSGPGIPRNELMGIFDRYKRTQNIKGIEGSGLGLYVLKNIIEAHKGSVSVESLPDSLTTFTIFLPLSEIPDSP
ncbi:response regulator [Candidatus Sumerlaeota bacterium]|nr:response regulator [Candidatus Sumerlaeota bacterium]